MHYSLLHWLLIINFVVIICLFGAQLLQLKDENSHFAINGKLFEKALEQLKSEAEEINYKGSSISGSIKSAMTTSATDMMETLIDYYRRESLKSHILFTTLLEGNLTDRIIQEYHLIHLVGNLLQNALEALQNSETKGSKRMELKIFCQKNELTVMVYNTNPQIEDTIIDLSTWTKVGYSTKGTEGRGNGLALVQRLVNEQDGILSLSTENGILIVLEFTI